MKNFSKDLLKWYKIMNFQMPWRKIKDPYKIWISEIMLQQTQVKTVTPYFKSWIKKYPTIKKLSKAKRDDILKIWEGLGYYQRAHNIHETSKNIVDNYNGKIPTNYDLLMKLKGIGDYTASAILSMAFNQKYAAVDGNIKRIISRVKKINNISNLHDESKSSILEFMTTSNASDLNQALMDLGREVCKPRNPLCQVCPINKYCLAYKSDTVNQFPVSIKGKTKPIYNVIVGFIWNSNKKILISKRKNKGLLGGMWELPGGKKKKQETNINCIKREIKEELNIDISVGKRIGKIKHQYSHFGINLTAYHCYYEKGKIKPLESEKIAWISYNDIYKFAFPSATHKIFKLYNSYE